ncbi:hypothetical protein [Thalassobius sp. MITS945101]|uniref:hypothetical protein n=1 Tax=Thalassobius sp. MITS945101 TaxID=3096994 RepID=UPI00399BA86F
MTPIGGPFLPRRDKRAVLSVALILSLPVFFTVRGGFRLAPSYSAETIGTLLLPVSYLLILPLTVLFLLRAKTWALPKLRLPLLYATIMICSLLLGLLMGWVDTNIARSVLRCVQTIYPVTAFVAAVFFFSRWRNDDDRALAIALFFKALCTCFTLYLLLYTLQTAISGPTSRFSSLADHIGPFTNPKVKRFFPVLLAFAATYFIASAVKQRGLKRGLSLLIGGLLILGVSAYWSRTALLALAIGLWCVFFQIRGIHSKYLAFSGTAALLVVAGLYLSTVDDGAFAGLSRTINTLLQVSGTGGETNEGDTVRADRLAFAIQVTLSRPFGSSFELYQQYLFPIADIPIAESGFLDVSVRGGAPALAVIIAMILRAAHNLRRAHNQPGISNILPAFIGLVLASFTFLQLATEAYSSILFWFMLGSCHVLVPTTPRETPMQD